MAAAIEIVEGPGRGWKYIVAGEEVRIGRGAGHQIKSDDPSWGGGHLRVQYRQGGYVVTNRMGHAVLIDGQTLADGEQVTWFTGVGLQPTGGTLLRLTSAVAPDGMLPEAGIIPIPPGGADSIRKKKMQNLALAGFICVAGVFLFGKQYFKPSPPSAVDLLDQQIRPELAQAYRDGRGEELVVVIRKGLVCRSKGDNLAARQKYQEARRLISELAGSVPLDELPPSLRTARRFVADRETELTGG
jgi:hypothetical protein